MPDIGGFPRAMSILENCLQVLSYENSMRNVELLAQLLESVEFENVFGTN